MTESFYKIPKDKFSNELRIEIFKVSRDKTSKELSNLFKLINCELNDNSIRELLKSDDFSLPKNGNDNLEVSDRINDAKFIEGKPDKLNCIQKSVEYYIKTYEKINELKYLIRALELVRKVKHLFEQKIVKLEQKIVNFFFLLESSYYQLRLIESALFIIEENSSKILIDYVSTQLNNSYESNNYNNAENYIIILNKLKHFDKKESKIQRALCLEKKGDFNITQKKPNRYYPTILTTYIEALKEVKGISLNTEFKTRLEQKIKIEQRTSSEMVKRVGVKVTPELNIQELVASQDIEGFKSGLDFILQFPIIKTESISKESENYYFGKYLKNYLKITNKGTVSGKTNEEGFNLHLAGGIYRGSVIEILKEIKLIMDLDRQISKDLISSMILNCKSPFIPKGREHFFIEGIYYGFQNNFILASHILIPQIENSLRNLIELSGRNATKNTEEIQNDNTLGSILGITENNKMLDKICDRNLLLELNSYLVDGNSVNLRNRLCHGLISPLELDYYGIYLWWLTLKMIIQTDIYFKIPK